MNRYIVAGLALGVGALAGGAAGYHVGKSLQVVSIAPSHAVANTARILCERYIDEVRKGQTIFGYEADLQERPPGVKDWKLQVQCTAASSVSPAVATSK